MHTHTRTTAALLFAAGLALTACSSHSDSSSPGPKNTGYFSTSPLPATTPAGEAPIPDTALAKGTRTAACWRAIRDQYRPGTVQLTGAPTEPPACLGLSTDEVSAIALDVAQYQLGG